MVRSRRDQNKEAFWRRMLREQQRSGLSGRAWCQRRGLRECNLYWWRRELRRRDARGRTFAPVQVIADTPVDVTDQAQVGSGGPEGRIEICLPGARRVHVVGRVERAMLAQVLGLLGFEAGRHDQWPRRDCGESQRCGDAAAEGGRC
jgi:hypothetical protein